MQTLDEPGDRLHVSTVTREIETATSIFERDGDRFVPTRLATGPWSAEALHGGPPAALLARAIERFEDGEQRFVSRVTVELLRPVPHAPLEVAAEWLRPGRNVQLVTATLIADRTVVARAVGLRMRRAHVDLPEAARTTEAPPPLPRSSRPAVRARRFLEGFHTHGVEHRFIRGAFEEPGPGTDWVRLKFPLVGGEQTTPLCRACAIADFGNGVSSVLSTGHTFINPDLTVILHRYPESEWVCLDSVSRVEEHGTGVAESALYDERGHIGRAVQSLLVARAGQR